MISERDYSFVDRLTHRVAYLGAAVQLSAADVESTLFGRAFEGIPVERPVFVTSLPRAGTTLLLEILARASGFASQCYRDMPFVLAPVLWGRLSGGFRRTSAPARERAHGDAVNIDYDSPEAFEEVVWKAFWPSRYRGDVIPLWDEEHRKPEFEDFLRRHMRKVILVRMGGAGGGRYLSKNNANIARIGLLRAAFPDASIVVPVRDPVQHAASMHRQHLRFSEIHDRDRFTLRYMRDIGHFEFGRLHKPLAFPGVDDLRESLEEDSLDYWIGYWIRAFSHLLRVGGDVTFVSYEALLRSGETGLERLGEALGLPEGTELSASASRLGEPRQHAVDSSDCDARSVDEARALHERLLERAIF